MPAPPEPHQRPLRTAVRPDDAGGAVGAGKHRRGQFAPLHVARDRDEADGRGARQPRRTGQRLPELAPAAREYAVVGKFSGTCRRQKHSAGPARL